MPPFLERAAIERLFGIQRRQAITLMHRVKDYRLARALVVDRSALTRYLRQRQGPSRQEQQRQQSVLQTLGLARREFAHSAGRRSLPIPAIPLAKDVYQRRPRTPDDRPLL